MKSVRLVLYFWSFVLASCAHSPSESKSTPALTVMTYNVENLFDTLHDQGKNDFAFLPLKLKSTAQHKAACAKISYKRYRDSCLYDNWDEPRLKLKMQRLADTILQMNKGKGPDILILEEVENKKVLNRLIGEHLEPAQYGTAILLEGPDHRGIDIAVLSRLEQSLPARLHKIPYKGKNQKDQSGMEKSRAILEAHLKLPDGEVVTIYGVHFPSPGHPSYWRSQAIGFLNKLMQKLPKNRMVIAGGDFNITAKEDAEDKQYNKFNPFWHVSHQVGCKSCKGTHYYGRNKTWSFLDALLFSKNLGPKGNSPWKVIASTIDVAQDGQYQLSKEKLPARFDFDSKIGVSDHLPLYLKLYPRTPETSDAMRY